MKLFKKKSLNAIIGLALGFASQAVLAEPTTLTYQDLLKDTSDKSVDGTINITLSTSDVIAATNTLFSQSLEHPLNEYFVCFCFAECKNGENFTSAGSGNRKNDAYTNCKNGLKIMCAIKGGVKNFKKGECVEK